MKNYFNGLEVTERYANANDNALFRTRALSRISNRSHRSISGVFIDKLYRNTWGIIERDAPQCGGNNLLVYLRSLWKKKDKGDVKNAEKTITGTKGRRDREEGKREKRERENGDWEDRRIKRERESREK